MHSPRLLVFLSLFCLATAAADATPSSDTLPRRPFIGVTVQPAPDHHVRVSKIIPGSSAARSDLQVGDILLSVNSAPVGSVDAFLAGLKVFKSGDRLVCRVQRGGTEMDIEVILGEWPREQPDDIQVLYDAVETPGATVRSIVTMPMGNMRKLPSILFVQGWDCGSIDLPLPGPNLMRELIYRLTRAGFVVMRSEKSGVGDSTGTPCRDVDFHDEVALFTSALRKLKSYGFVDTGNVFIFGLSAGGWVAPLVATAEPVKGIVAYGTVVCHSASTWSKTGGATAGAGRNPIWRSSTLRSSRTSSAGWPSFCTISWRRSSRCAKPRPGIPSLPPWRRGCFPRMTSTSTVGGH
jgi:pimeloyl-ACP methyl ester carboxylesterase